MNFIFQMSCVCIAIGTLSSYEFPHFSNVKPPIILKFAKSEVDADELSFQATSAVKSFISSFWQLAHKSERVSDLFHIPTTSTEFFDYLYKSNYKTNLEMGVPQPKESTNKLVEAFKKYNDVVSSPDGFTNYILTTQGRVLTCKGLLTTENADELARKYFDVLDDLSKDLPQDANWKLKFDTLVSAKYQFQSKVSTYDRKTQEMFGFMYQKVISVLKAEIDEQTLQSVNDDANVSADWCL